MHKLVLHIGTHKTGTTSIQRFLSANRKMLRKNQIFYPGSDVGGHFKQHYAHHRIAHALSGEVSQAQIDEVASYFDAVRENTRTDETVLISAEPLYRHVKRIDEGEAGRRFDGGAGYLGDPLPYIKALKRAIGDFEVKVVLMLRRQDLFIESLYPRCFMGLVSGVGRRRCRC